MYPIQIQEHEQYPGSLGRLGIAPAIIAAIPVLFKSITNIFGQKVTPEAQAQKAGVWGAMLTEFLTNTSMTGAELGQKWQNQLPFKQSGTKSDFVRDRLNGKSRSSIIDHLVQKINDELVKGKLPGITKAELMNNFYAGQVIAETDILPSIPVPTWNKDPRPPVYINPNTGQQVIQDPYANQASFIPGIDQNTMLIGGGILGASALAYYLIKKK